MHLDDTPRGATLDLSPAPMLTQIADEWTRRGWDLSDLHRFRMQDPPAPTPPAPPAPPAPTPPAPEPPDPGKTFTQAELDRIATREKEQGKRAAEQEIATALGVSVEEAKTIIAAAKKREDDAKDETQREREAVAAEKAAATAEKAAAARERHETRIERVLARAGVVDDKKITRIMRLVDAEIADDASLEDVTEAVNALREDMPELFPVDETGTPPKPKPPAGDPKGPPRKPKPTEDAFARGAEKAKASATSNGYAILDT